MKMRIVYDSNHAISTRIENAETGEVIPGVRVVRFEHAAGDLPALTLELITDYTVEVLAEGELEDVTEVGNQVARKRLVIPRPEGVAP